MKKKKVEQQIEAPEPQEPESGGTMADNNHDPKVVGGLQPIYCPVCKKEVTHLDSYELNLGDNARIHYPVCWQKASLAALE